MTVEPEHQSILIHARQEDVFRYFTEPDAIVAWMGDEASVDPRPGGAFILRFHDKVVEGRYVEVDFPRRLIIGWGRRGSATFPPHASRLEVVLESEDLGTRVTIIHHGLPLDEQARHAQGWRHYLGRLERVAAGQDVAI
ncbi:MAG: hypothetical protein EOP18_11965, partial [Rhizobiaceae bacterium]